MGKVAEEERKGNIQVTFLLYKSLQQEPPPPPLLIPRREQHPQPPLLDAAQNIKRSPSVLRPNGFVPFQIQAKMQNPEKLFFVVLLGVQGGMEGNQLPTVRPSKPPARHFRSQEEVRSARRLSREFSVRRR
ncbi:hypothetical protein A6R68_09292 [Neotoma lepida]|uniref:Uncharacterized protein n=1 Tax=Neotoma lepida TaxID=56216 RepID=A0A1A6G197_NEOLE|nr:hypothetical protein A6R68_09292 [Neotoma lepida]